MIKELTNFVNFAENGVHALKISNAEFLSQVKLIEDEIKHNIVHKSEKIYINEFGKAFLPYAKKILILFSEGIDACNKNNVYDKDNQITLGISMDSAASWWFKCIKNFNKIHSGLRVSVIAQDSLSEAMLEDSTIIFWCFDKDLPNFNKLWYIEYKYSLFASVDYLNNHNVPTLDTIKNHKIIAYSGEDNNLLMTNWHLGGEYGLPILNPTIFSQSRDVITKMVADGVGIGSVCERQDVYYGYPNIERVLKTVNGPVLRSYFAVRSDLAEQMQCNTALMSRLFRGYFEENSVEVFDI